MLGRPPTHGLSRLAQERLHRARRRRRRVPTRGAVDNVLPHGARPRRSRLLEHAARQLPNGRHQVDSRRRSGRQRLSAVYGAPVRTEPVVLVHGWGGSFRRTWQEPGWEALLNDAGRRVIGVDLLGHGTAPMPHEPEAYADLTTAVTSAVGDERFDAVGFSLGAMTLLELACRAPERFGRLVVAGVGANGFRDDA